jgi:hypothetical protein
VKKYHHLSKLYLGNFCNDKRQTNEPTSSTDRKGEKGGERGKKAKREKE